MGNLLGCLSKRCIKEPTDYSSKYAYTFKEEDLVFDCKLDSQQSKNVSDRTAKNQSCSYAELLLGYGDRYWTELIQGWIEDVKCTQLNDELKETYFDQKSPHDFKKYIKMVLDTLKESQYNDEKWNIVHLKLLQLLKWLKQKQEQNVLTMSSSESDTKMEQEETKESTNELEKIINSMHEILKNKNKKILQQETEDLTCCSNSNNNLRQIIDTCQPFKRIEIVLRFYHCWMNMIHWDSTSMDDLLIVDKYGHQQLSDDFSHLKIIHIDGNVSANKNSSHQYTIGRKMCMYFESYFPCKNPMNCKAFLRHHRYISDELNNEYNQDEKNSYDNVDTFGRDIKDAAFQQDCYKLHSYFFHSTIKFGRDAYKLNDEEEREMDNISRITCFVRSLSNAPMPYKKKAYIGKKEDNLWWNGIVERQTDNEIYRMLVNRIGVFRAQSPHGFSAGQCRAIAHFKPKFRNIKEEVLYNEFERLSCESWNQTLRKSTIFEHSWAGKKIRTKYSGYYDDRVTGQYEEWKEGAEIDIESIVTLKLYTDFDKLQFALKRCFRYETFSDILSVEEQGTMSIDEINSLRQLSIDNEMILKYRLENFYHWRGALLIVLNKYGTNLNADNNMILYHGVNQKMLIKTTTFAFNGPLSTSLSYHVARTFGTAKGMVLKVTSYFPRLNYCNAFDASLLSDYPEEQEWLIGFMYVRLLEVRTRKLTDKFESYKDLANKIPLASWTREAFFCLHLFKEQIFSMSEHLERVLAQFLKVNRFECCKNRKKYKYKHNRFEDWDKNINGVVMKVCSKYHLKRQRSAFFQANVKGDNTKEDAAKSERIFGVIWNKFNEFRTKPNRKQRIKFDTISANLQRFFMRETDEINMKTKQNKWRISWNEIIMVYPNVQEIHFVNQYKLTDELLYDFIKCIKRKDNKLQKVLFLYYNYKRTNKNDETNKPANEKIFQDPDTLDDSIKNDLINLQWVMKYGAIGKHGYRIRLYKNERVNF